MTCVILFNVTESVDTVRNEITARHHRWLVRVEQFRRMTASMIGGWRSLPEIITAMTKRPDLMTVVATVKMVEWKPQDSHPDGLMVERRVEEGRGGNEKFHKTAHSIPKRSMHLQSTDLNEAETSDSGIDGKYRISLKIFPQKENEVKQIGWNVIKHVDLWMRSSTKPLTEYR